MDEKTIVEEKAEQEPKATPEIELADVQPDIAPETESEDVQPDVTPETKSKDIQPDATPETEKTPPTESDASKKKTASESLKDAWKQVFGQALSVALKGRGNVVMVRVNDKALQHLDMLVEAEITKSRSESAAFLINEGIYANQELFDRIGAIAQQISDLRTQLREQVQREIQNKQ